MILVSGRGVEGATLDTTDAAELGEPQEAVL